MVTYFVPETGVATKLMDFYSDEHEDSDTIADMFRNCPARWLSLSCCVERLIKSWPALKLYFVNLSEENCDSFVWNFVKSQGDGLEDDIVKPSIPELYLNFYGHFLNTMIVPILCLEKMT